MERTVLRAVRRLVPRSLRRRLRRAAFDWLDLSWTTASGVHLRVANYNEWIIYNEIFVDAEYDRAIDLALRSDRAGQPLRVVDLGANVGFFTLRLVDRARVSGLLDTACSIMAVEGHPRLAAELARRVRFDNSLAGQVNVVAGLAGADRGTGVLFSADGSPGDSSTKRAANSAGLLVPFVDIDRLVADVAAIDLLKCDVEGAELDVIRAHPALLRKSRVAVFELHEDLCPATRCRDALLEAGFGRELILRARGGCVLSAFLRD